ncbi:hypothetical protein [Terrabacter carboxydivorans]|uniref:Uncharacterized protein n=1 Tax=Terrabacter carboxydivorans TaxID=619730 RepID=A0ABN3KVK1_9MICO
MEFFGVEITAQDLIKILPGVLAVLAAALRAIPNLVTSSRSRRSHALSGRHSPSRVRSYSAPPPFSELFARRYDAAADDPEAQTARERMRTRTLWICGAGVISATLLTGAYLVYGPRVTHLPGWSLVLALMVGVGVDIVLARTIRDVRRDPGRGSAATPQQGEVLVSGNEDDVKQHSLAALVDLGARVVRVEGARILAATGVSFGQDMWMGEIIWVAVSEQHLGQVRVVVRSIKTDFVSRSRSRRNVLRFLESWASFPGEQALAPGLWATAGDRVAAT